MNPWVIVGLVLYVAVEWITASWLASVIGWVGVVVVMLSLVLIGVVVMRRAGFAAVRSLRPVSYEGGAVLPGATPETMSQVSRDVGDAGALFVAGVLIAIPGLVTSAVGLLLLVPPVRRFARRRVSRSVRRRAQAAGVVFDARVTTVQGDVVTGDVVREERPAAGEIIAGEIVGEDRPSAADGPRE